MVDVSLKKRIWGWYFFDWASQPFYAVLNTFIFSPFFASIAAAYFLNSGFNEELADAKAQSLWAWSVALFGIIVAFSAPVFGAIADSTGRRMPWVMCFSLMYVIGSGFLWFTDPAASNLYWMLASFGVGFIGVEYLNIFVNAQIPTLGTRDEIGKISGSACAFGYLGGFVSLVIALALIVEQDNGLTIVGLEPLFGLAPEEREGTRATGIFTALWFAVFMVPYFMWVREDTVSSQRASLPKALNSVMASIKGLHNKPSLASYLLSSMLYRDGLNGLYTFGGVYAALVLNWEISQIGAFGVVALLGSALFSYLGGFADRKFGPKPIINFSIIVLIGLSFIVVNLSPTTLFGVSLAEETNLENTLFMVCGVLIGGFGGVLLSTSRTLMVRHCDPNASTEYFGLYGLSGRATAFLAPLLIGITTQVTGSARLGISPVIGLFVLSLIFLIWVNKDGKNYS